MDTNDDLGWVKGWLQMLWLLMPAGWIQKLILNMNVKNEFRNWMLVGYVDQSRYEC